MGRPPPPPPPRTLPPPRHPLKIQPFEDFDDDDEDLRLGPPPSRPPLPRTALQDRCPNLRRRPDIECGSAANRKGGGGPAGVDAAAERTPGGVRGRREGGRAAAEVHGAGHLLQPPSVRGATAGGRGGVRVPPPRWHHHPLPRCQVRASPVADRRWQREAPLQARLFPSLLMRVHLPLPYKPLFSFLDASVLLVV